MEHIKAWFKSDMAIGFAKSPKELDCKVVSDLCKRYNTKAPAQQTSINMLLQVVPACKLAHTLLRITGGHAVARTWEGIHSIKTISPLSHCGDAGGTLCCRGTRARGPALGACERNCAEQRACVQTHGGRARAC
jgi:hypothetical protein